MRRSQLPRYLLSATLCAALIFVIAEFILHLREVQAMVPSGWEGKDCGADSDLGVWGVCGPIQPRPRRCS